MFNTKVVFQGVCKYWNTEQYILCSPMQVVGIHVVNFDIVYFILTIIVGALLMQENTSGHYAKFSNNNNELFTCNGDVS